MATKNTVKTPAKLPELPKGILVSDLKEIPWRQQKKVAAFGEKDSYGYAEPIRFEMWHTTAFGWVIPTLLIRKAGYRRTPGTADRTYATMMDGRQCRVGLGPHVTHRVTVHVKKSRLAVLQRYVDLWKDGQVSANETRDRISTRRANTVRRRYGFLGGY